MFVRVRKHKQIHSDSLIEFGARICQHRRQMAVHSQLSSRFYWLHESVKRDTTTPHWDAPDVVEFS